jgi:hypothetical protein
MGKAAARAKMPRSVINRCLSLDQNSGPQKAIHLGTHPWTHTDLQGLSCEG